MDSRFPGKSQQLVLPNDTYKAKLLGGLADWKLEELESWLFHGTECLDDILRERVSSGHVHLMSKKYSAGTYFASDPRLAHYFVRRTLRMVAEGQERLSCPVCLRSYSRSSDAHGRHATDELFADAALTPCGHIFCASLLSA